MMYDQEFFDKPIDRRGTACEKWDGIREREGKELLPMWVADMDFRCAQEIEQAVAERATHPVFGYTEATAEATEAMLGFMKRRHGLELTAEQQAMLPCVITGLRAAVLSLTDEGDSVIIQSPVYGPFRFSILENKRQVADCPLLRHEDGSYHMDLNRIEDACKAGAKLMMLCNPHNPVSHAWTERKLRELWNLLDRYGVPLISDEIHEDFVFDRERFTPVLRLIPDEGARVVSLTSASKTFNLAGLQQAALFTRNEEIKQKLTDLMRRVGVVQGNIFAMTATEAAFRHGDAWLDGMLAYVEEATALLGRELKTRLPKAILTPMDATYLAWVDLRAYGMTTDQLMKRCYAAGVAFTPGTFFGEADGEGFLRVNLACPHAQTTEAIKRLEKAVKG